MDPIKGDPEIRFEVKRTLGKQGFPELWSDDILSMAVDHVEELRRPRRSQVTNDEYMARLKLDFWLRASLANYVRYLVKTILENRHEFTRLINN